MARTKTRYVGVYFRHGKNRIGADGKPDKCFDILYKKNNKLIWEKIGWISEGYTVQDAIEIRGKRVKAIRHPELIEEIEKSGITITLDEAWEAFYTRWCMNLKNPDDYALDYQKHLKPKFGSMYLTDITPKILEAFTQDLQQNKSPATAKKILALFRNIFNRCKNWEMIPETAICPVSKLKKIKVDNEQERFLTRREASFLLDALIFINCKLYYITKISLYSGMRLSEILEIQKQNINLNAGIIYIQDAKSGNRPAYISDELKKDLKVLLNDKKSNYVLHDDKGKKLSKYNISQQFARVIKEIGFNDNINNELHKVVFHTLRHTFCSWLAIDGVTLYTISKLVGHKDSKMTQRYAKLSPDCMRDAIKRIDGNLARGH
ncbi:MAG: site-specific integrase [Desulfovibrio sp.]|jgi:integrase|nr:site-specific integrase [Desulfovibrio sp.]